MRCPACKNLLSKFTKSNIMVLVCDGECGGLWFSQSQIKRLTNLKLGLGASLLQVNRVDGIKAYRKVEHICPQCQTTLLFRHFFSKKDDTEVNQCAKCGGFWVDAAGLSKLKHMDDNQKKQKAINSYFRNIIQKKY